MRILNICFARGKGGIEQAFVDYGEALAHAGHAVEMLCDPVNPYQQDMQAACLPVRHLRQYGAWDIRAAWGLRRRLREHAPDMVIAHGNRAISLLTAPVMQAISAPACPVLAVAHNYKLKRFTRLDGAFAITRHIAGALEQAGLPADTIIHMPNMVRLPEAPVTRARHSPPVIGTMGRFVAKKGFADFLEALARLHGRGVVFHAVIAGEGEEQAALQGQAQQAGLAGLVSFPGWVRDKAAFYAQCDIFCLPSRHEPFGIVLLEAMSHGLPIVSTRSEGPSEILTHGQDALLCDIGDSEGMAAALQQLLDAPDTAAGYGHHARKTVQEHYTLDAAAKRLDAAIRDIRAKFN